MNGRYFSVIRPGSLTTVQDLGRLGQAHLGVPKAGALDAPAHRLANRLVGNPPEAATLETTLDGVGLRFFAPAHVAVTGAVADVVVDGRLQRWGAPVELRAGGTLQVGSARYGLRSYVAIDGGIDVPPVLGSRSRDLLAGIGPPPARLGQRLSLGDPWASPPAIDLTPWPVPVPEPALSIALGPRHDWFAPEAVQLLTTRSWRVTDRANRVGVGLAGPPLPRLHHQELPSEGTVVGAIEVPADGQPLIFLNDHPTTVGYPVIAVVSPESLAAVAQVRPGDTLRFAIR